MGFLVAFVRKIMRRMYLSRRLTAIISRLKGLSKKLIFIVRRSKLSR